MLYSLLSQWLEMTILESPVVEQFPHRSLAVADTGFQERGVKAREARAQIFGHAHKVINHAPNCRDREAVSCFLTVKCTI